MPPAGGPHDPPGWTAGSYDVPVRDENAVHSLEHGTVWITYTDDAVRGRRAPSSRTLLPDEGILSPYPAQDAPVIVTVWGRQLELDVGRRPAAGAVPRGVRRRAHRARADGVVRGWGHETASGGVDV